MRYRLGDDSLLRQRIHRSQSACEGIGGERIEMAGFWIDLRNDAWGEDVRQRVLTFVQLFMFGLGYL